MGGGLRGRMLDHSGRPHATLHAHVCGIGLSAKRRGSQRAGGVAPVVHHDRATGLIEFALRQHRHAHHRHGRRGALEQSGPHPVRTNAPPPHFVQHVERLPHGCWVAKIGLQDAVIVGGGMHQASSMMKDMPSAMLMWCERVGPQATPIAGFLHHPWTRERFVVACLVDDLGASGLSSAPSQRTRRGGCGAMYKRPARRCSI